MEQEKKTHQDLESLRSKDITVDYNQPESYSEMVDTPWSILILCRKTLNKVPCLRNLILQDPFGSWDGTGLD